MQVKDFIRTDTTTGLESAEGRLFLDLGHVFR